MNNEPAREPNDLARFFVQRANAGDLDGIVAPFEPEALVSGTNGGVIVGHQAIRAKYAAVLARQPHFSLGIQQQAMVHGDIALTSIGSTTKTAAQQPRSPAVNRMERGSG